MCKLVILLYYVLIVVYCDGGDDWHNYRDISDPNLWTFHPGWELCMSGEQQSPINIQLNMLKHDPNLTYFRMDKHKVSGKLENVGQALVFLVNQNARQHVTITGGPLNHRYQIAKFYVHYGNVETRNGSQHEIDGYKFPAEVQLYGWNIDLYQNMSVAQNKTNGIVAVAFMIDLSENPNRQFYNLIGHAKQLLRKRKSIDIRYFDLHRFLPTTNKYITYRGSTTYPGCWEDTTWILLNKPIYINRNEFYDLRRLSTNVTQANSITRIVQPLNNRQLRTNIPKCAKDNNVTHYYHCFRCKHQLNPIDRWGIKDYIVYSVCDL